MKSTNQPLTFLQNTIEAIDTWNIPRNLEQLKSFISSHEDRLDVEEFEF